MAVRMEIARLCAPCPNSGPLRLRDLHCMARDKHHKSKPKKTDHSQRMNRLKAKALTKVAGHVWGYDQRHRSVVLLTEALRRDPTNPDMLLNLATALGKQRNYEKAEELLARVMELAPR